MIKSRMVAGVKILLYAEKKKKYRFCSGSCFAVLIAAFCSVCDYVNRPRLENFSSVKIKQKDLNSFE